MVNTTAWAFRGLLLAGALLTLESCSGPALRASEPPAPEPVLLTVPRTARLVPSGVKDREGWAQAVLDALEAQKIAPTVEPICQVLAVIEQESGFQANPGVKDLPRIVRRRLDAYAGKLGVIGRSALKALLQHKAPGESRTFEKRLKGVRTEQDLDRFFRDLLEAYERHYPAFYSAADLASELFTSKRLAELNPITTAGSMQVSVRYAVEQDDGEHSEQEVREQLYTRAGGVHHGTSRLLGYPAGYPQPVFRFADYNAGFYASRNAALQAQLSRLTGRRLLLDGDLLLYNDQGKPRDEDSQSLSALLAFRQRHAPKLSERQLRKDVRKEKEASFEKTETWRALKQAYERVTGERPAYARLPEVTLQSPKLSRERTTAWFAHSVDQRFQRCLARHRVQTP
ncbi:DUF1615 domain-containing protein [Stigmatella aurantiaca]|uniref:Conserved uncharacterized protein n=1 Tax=Stigmatella aurantiaca (strain DW4/3-1) TaxID=378806 RepID=Q09DU8_STIAD|nr:DUF1615 domain-containing protein [Stigmatella aurantiaca]ADO75216.1 conserved uncharacterized protein [Stigmatella aurantiaca DW4/3-1]EAU69851.1 conserved hypothetical protein [Stigmatella aurantiaca DW4/3-1]